MLTLIPWITFWVSASIDSYIGGFISICICALTGLIFFRFRKTIYDAISVTAVVGFSIDAAERIRVHIFDYDPDADDSAYGTSITPKSVIALSTFKGSFHNIKIPKKGVKYEV